MKAKPVILIVDDLPQNSELLEAYLAPQGYEIVTAANGEEALEKLSGNQIDLMLLDVMMPGIDGFEVTRRVRQDGTQRLLPIILVTSLQEREDRVKGIEAGCDDFISKPVDKMELLARVRSLLKVKAYNDLMSNYREELESEVTRRTEELRLTLKVLHQKITERKQAEDVLRISEGRYRMAEAIGHIGNWEYNLQTTKFWGSDEAKRIYGFDPGALDFSTDEVENRIPERERVHQALVDLIEADKPYNLEFEIHPKNSLKSKIISSDAKLKRDKHGNPLLVAGVIQDITERKRAEDEIHILNEQLEQRVKERTAQLETMNKEMESFSYSVSHDLRAPLRGIDGFSQALLEDYGGILDDRGKGYLERVRSAAQHMGNLIEDLLKLSRVTRSEFRSERVDLSALVRAIADIVQQNNPQQAVDLFIQDGVVVRGDANLLGIALTNLLENAWKFTGRTTHPRIEFGVTIKDGEDVYYIRDNGVGFDMTYANKLFGTFQRLHSADEFPGTGIGLATVKRVFNRHGYQVWAAAEVGKGATFYFTLEKT